MKKTAVVLMTVCVALSANAFAAGKQKHKHTHHKKAAVTTPANTATPAAAEVPAK